MKFDLFTSIGIAIVGVVIGFFITTLLVPQLENYSINTIDAGSNGKAADNGYNYADYDAPNPEVFNYDALNPTVEVYVGQCEEYDSDGNCVEVVSDEDLEVVDETTIDGDSNSSNSETSDQENG